MRRIKFIFLILILLLLLPLKSNAFYETILDVTKMDIFEIQDAIKNNLLTYEGLVRVYLDRINYYDNNYNTIINLNNKALEEAKACDLEYQKNKEIPSYLYCMPILVKDNIDVVGLPTTVGTKSLKDSYPKEDAQIIKNLKKKGAIILGKTNMSEFAFLASSSKSSYGEVKNAYNPFYTSYGSSGGSAVATALQFAPLAIGTDTNSSIRVPSAVNNVIGMRPTKGLLDTTGIFAYDITRDVPGPIAKTAKESAVLLSGMMGKSDDYYLDSIEKSIENKRIIVLSQFLYGDDNIYINATKSTEKKIIEKIESLVKSLEDAGVDVLFIDDFYKKSYYNIANKTLSGFTMCYAYENYYIKNTSSQYQTFFSLANADGHIYSLWSYVDDCDIDISKKISNYEEIKSPFSKSLEDLFKKYDADAILYPTIKNKVDKIGSDNLLSPVSLISPVLGVPAVTTKLGSIDDLYYGVELLTLKNKEDLLYNFVYQIESIYDPYVLPKEVPNLYEIPMVVEDLKNTYLENKNILIPYIFETEVIKNYKTVREKVIDFLKNYNDYEEKEEQAIKLLGEYKMSLVKIEENNKCFVLLVISLLFLIIIFNILIKKSKRKRKKYRRKR